MRKLLGVACLFLATVAGGAFAPPASACVTCDNMQCVAIATSGALDCSSGWFLGSYCNLTGNCTVGAKAASRLDRSGYRAWLPDLPAAEPPVEVADVSPWRAFFETAGDAAAPDYDRTPSGV